MGAFSTIPRAVPVESYILTIAEARPHFAPLAPLPIPTFPSTSALLPTVPRRGDIPATPPVATPAILAALVPRDDFVAIPHVYSCHSCGHTDHQRRDCPFQNERDINFTRLPWNKSPMGLLWSAHGPTCFQTTVALPECNLTTEARNQGINRAPLAEQGSRPHPGLKDKRRDYPVRDRDRSRDRDRHRSRDCSRDRSDRDRDYRHGNTFYSRR